MDLFAGAGGASEGIRQALGRTTVDVAIDTDPVALAIHEANHPRTRHLRASVRDLDPRTVAHGRQVDLLWASPPCTPFSCARGDKPADADVASLPWEVVRWAAALRPRVVMVENVPQFELWGHFSEFCANLRALGYVVTTISKAAQIAAIGNSVCPAVAKALVEATNL
ncbi:MAG: DNA cytosine methyltransferase [Magnetococcales bacterium]|nr:DNA cytosine methyltransferase [Magnetococcales bacterium]